MTMSALLVATVLMSAPDQSWVWIDMGPGERYLAFTYVDASAGPSAKGILAPKGLTAKQAKAAANAPDRTVRLSPPGFPTTGLTLAEVKELKLPAAPSWLSFFSKPKSELAWRNDPKLSFHADDPNDLEARFFFPEQHKVEQMWVTLNGVDAEVGGYTGKLLNTPNSKSDVREGSQVTVRVTPGVPEPVWVTKVMRANLKDWKMACTACGFDLHFTPVAELIAAQFKDAPRGSVMEKFTTRCPVCGKTMTVEHR